MAIAITKVAKRLNLRQGLGDWGLFLAGTGQLIDELDKLTNVILCLTDFVKTVNNRLK